MLNGVLCCQAWRNDASELMRVDTLKLTNSCHCDEHRMYKHSNTCKSSRRGSTHTEQTHPRYRRPSRVYVSYPPSGSIEQSSSPPVWNDCFILQYKYIIGFILNQVFENEKNEYLLYLNRKNLALQDLTSFVGSISRSKRLQEVSQVEGTGTPYQRLRRKR